MDALYAGVPVVTRSDGQDMSSRVTTSANIVLGIDNEMNAMGLEEYAQKAITLAKNRTLFLKVRKKLIDSCLQEDPMHPFWDMKRYVRNLEKGFKEAWRVYLAGETFEHTDIVDDEDDEDEEKMEEEGTKRVRQERRREAIEVKYVELKDEEEEEEEEDDTRAKTQVENIDMNLEEWEWEPGDEL